MKMNLPKNYKEITGQGRKEALGLSTRQYVEAVRNAIETEDWEEFIKLKKSQVRWLYHNSHKCDYVLHETDVWLMVQKAYMAGLEKGAEKI